MGLGPAVPTLLDVLLVLYPPVGLPPLGDAFLVGIKDLQLREEWVTLVVFIDVVIVGAREVICL